MPFVDYLRQVSREWSTENVPKYIHRRKSHWKVLVPSLQFIQYCTLHFVVQELPTLLHNLNRFSHSLWHKILQNDILLNGFIYLKKVENKKEFSEYYQDIIDNSSNSVSFKTNASWYSTCALYKRRPMKLGRGRGKRQTSYASNIGFQIQYQSKYCYQEIVHLYAVRKGLPMDVTVVHLFDLFMKLSQWVHYAKCHSSLAWTRPYSLKVRKCTVYYLLCSNILWLAWNRFVDESSGLPCMHNTQK